jgi:hypothetical protein
MIELRGYQAIANAMGISVSKLKTKHIARMKEQHIIYTRRVRRKGRPCNHFEWFTWENRLQVYCTRYNAEVGPL